MEFISRLADTTDKEKIIDELLDGVEGSFDLAVLFITPYAPYDAKAVYRQIEARLGRGSAIFCAARAPALSAASARSRGFRRHR